MLKHQCAEVERPGLGFAAFGDGSLNSTYSSRSSRPSAVRTGPSKAQITSRPPCQGNPGHSDLGRAVADLAPASGSDP